jgi:hypothetical protein
MTKQRTQPGQPAALRLTAELGHSPRHPTLAECHKAGRGPDNCPGDPYDSGGLPDTPEERERFEAYMLGHHWDCGKYDKELRCYDTVLVRCLYGVWRDRGSLPTVWPNVRAKLPAAVR